MCLYTCAHPFLPNAVQLGIAPGTCAPPEETHAAHAAHAAPPAARAALCPTPPQLASSSRLAAAGSASLWSTWALCWLGGPAGWGGRGQHRHQGWLKARCGTATAAARNVAPWCTLLQVPGCSLQRRTSQPAKSQAVKSSPLQTSHTRQGTATLATQSVSSHSPLNALPHPHSQGCNGNYRMTLLTTANPAMADLVRSSAPAVIGKLLPDCVLGPPWRGWRFSAAASGSCCCCPAER